MADDLASRVEALEAENGTLKDQLAALTARLDALETDGGERKAAPRSSGRTLGSAARKRPATKKKPKSGAKSGAKSGVRKRLAKRRGSSSRAEAKSSTRQLESDPELQARHRVYNIGKQKVSVIVPAEYQDSKANPQPPKELTLEHCYGYNGHQARANLFYTQDGASIAYSIAATGVVHNLAASSQKHFTGHNEDVLCMAKHPTQDIFATGQRDPKGAGTPYLCVWNGDGELLKQITYHERGICAIAFSADGKYVASVGEDDDHTLALFGWEGKKTTPLVSGPSGKDNAWSMGFKPVESKSGYEVVVLGKAGFRSVKLNPKASSNSDKFKVKKISTYGQTKITQKGHLSLSFYPDGRYVVGTVSGHLYVMSAENKLEQFPKVGNRALGAVAALEDGGALIFSEGTLSRLNAEFKSEQEIAVGENAGAGRAISYVEGKCVIGTKKNNIYEVDLKENSVRTITAGHTDEVWGLAPHPTEPLVVSTAMDKLVNVWNTQTHEPVNTLTCQSPPRSATWSPDGQFLVVGEHSGHVSCFDSKFNVVWRKKVAQEQVDALDVSPDGAKVACGSWDQMTYQVNMEDGKTLTKSRGHTSSVLFLNYSGCGTHFITNSRDYEILFWKAEDGKRVTRFADVADLDFPKWQCFLGWPVQGIWDGASDGTDVNAVDKAPDGSVLAVGDDFGLVKVYAFPSITKKSKHRDYQGHASHVSNVRFSPDSSKLFSAGGADTGVFQWSLA